MYKEKKDALNEIEDILNEGLIVNWLELSLTLTVELLKYYNTIDNEFKIRALKESAKEKRADFKN